MSPENVPELDPKLNPNAEFANIGVAFLITAEKIKALAEYAKAEGPPSKQKLGEEILEALFSPVKVEEMPPDDEAIQLAKQYEELVDQG